MVSRADDRYLRSLLESHLGAEAADKLVERLPMALPDDLATKTDLRELATKAELRELRGELLFQMGELRGEMGELRGEMGNLRADLERAMRTQTFVVAGLVMSGMVGTATITAALVG